MKGADIVAYLVDGGDASAVDADGLVDPWPSIVQQLLAVDPLERGPVFEQAADALNGRADEIRAAVYTAMAVLFAANKGRGTGLVEVPPALGDIKPPMDPIFIQECLKLEEDGDSKMFTELFKSQCIYDHSEDTWYLWQGQHWEPDRVNAVITLLGTQVAYQYAQYAADLIAHDKGAIAGGYMKRAERLHTRRRKEHVLWAAASQEGMRLSGDEWDEQTWLLGCPNGVIDLQSGKFRSGRPEDMIRTTVPTEWIDLGQPCPRWEAFLREVFAGDDEIVAFIHRLLGYGVTGQTTEHVFPVFWGAGRNGKSTLVETLADVLGKDVATSIPSDEIMRTRYTGGPQPFIYQLQGKRLVWSSETNPDRSLNAGLVKQLTGADRIKVRTLHAKPVEFTPTHLLMLLTNHKPKVDAQDLAVWDRVALIPFNMRFVDKPDAENERPRDPALPARLREEAAGILAWLVRGTLAWQENGLAMPEKVRLATQEYRDEVDTVAQFLDDHCVLSADARVTHLELYKAYTKWCKDLRLWPEGSRAFGKAVKSRFESNKMTNGMTYFGIGLPLNAPAGQLQFGE